MTCGNRFYQIALRVAAGVEIPSVPQSHGFCGPASLRSILLYRGVDISEEELANLSGATHQDGVEDSGLVAAAQALGFKAWAKDNATFEELEQLLESGVPVIVHWFSTDQGHYSVVKQIKDGKIELMDPEIEGIRSMSIEEFNKVWFNFVGDQTTQATAHSIIVIE